jgi:hypothetical protein
MASVDRFGLFVLRRGQFRLHYERTRNHLSYLPLKRRRLKDVRSWEMRQH